MAAAQSSNVPPRLLGRLVLILLIACFGSHVSGAPDGSVIEQDVSAEEARAALESIDGLSDVATAFDGPVLLVQGTADDSESIEAANATLEAMLDPDLFRNEIALSLDFSDRVQGAASRVRQKIDQLLGYLPLLPIAFGVLLLALAIAWLVGRLGNLFRRMITNPFLSGIAMRGVQLSVLLAGVLVALEILDAVALIGGVLGAAGVFGLAIGFAFKDLVENYIASILLSLRQPFRPQDHVVIDSHEGLVTSMNTRTTVLTTFDGNIVRIPNATVFKTSLINYTADSRRRFSFQVGVGYDVDLHHAIRTGIDVLSDTDGVMANPPPSGMITELGDSSITLKLLGWVDQSTHDFSRVRSFTMQRVKSRFDELDIDMPEPIYKIKMASPSEPRGPEAPRVIRNPELTDTPTSILADRTTEAIVKASNNNTSNEDLLDENAAAE